MSEEKNKPKMSKGRQKINDLGKVFFLRVGIFTLAIIAYITGFETAKPSETVFVAFLATMFAAVVARFAIRKLRGKEASPLRRRGILFIAYAFTLGGLDFFQRWNRYIEKPSKDYGFSDYLLTTLQKPYGVSGVVFIIATMAAALFYSRYIAKSQTGRNDLCGLRKHMAIFVMLAGLACLHIHSKQPEFRFEHYSNCEEITKALLKLHPIGSSHDALIETLRKAGAYCEKRSVRPLDFAPESSDTTEIPRPERWSCGHLEYLVIFGYHWVTRSKLYQEKTTDIECQFFTEIL